MKYFLTSVPVLSLVTDLITASRGLTQPHAALLSTPGNGGNCGQRLNLLHPETDLYDEARAAHLVPSCVPETCCVLDPRLAVYPTQDLLCTRPKTCCVPETCCVPVPMTCCVPETCCVPVTCCVPDPTPWLLLQDASSNKIEFRSYRLHDTKLDMLTSIILFYDCINV